MNIIESMLKLNDSDIEAPNSKSDLDCLGESISDMDTIKNLGTMYQAKVLYHVNKNWSDIEMSVTGYWAYDFYKWAQQFTQNDQTIPHKSTIDNKIAVYRDYVAEQLIEIPESVLINKESIKTDIMMVSYTKLLYARTTARAGKMTPKMWSMVFNKSVSVAQLNREIKQIKHNDDVSLFAQNGIIYVSDGCSKIAIGHLNYDESDKSLWKRGIEKFAKFCKVDEFVL